MRSGASPRGVQACPIIIRAREGHKGVFAATTRRRPSGNLRCGNRLWLTRQRKTPAKRHSMTRGGLFAGTKCPYSASRVKSWTYLWVADAKPSATQYHPGGVVLITQPPRWLTTDLVCSYFGRESTQSQSSKGARAHVMRSGASLRGVQARGIIIRARGGRWGSALRPALAEGTKMRETSPLAHSARPPLNAHLRTRGGHMRRLNTPLSDRRVYSWALLSVTDAK